MIIIANILAEGGGITALLPLLIFAAIGIIGSMVKKKQQEAEAQKHQTGREAPPPAPQQRPATEVQRRSLVSAALKSMGIEAPQPRAKPVVKPKPTPPALNKLAPAPAEPPPEALGSGIKQHVEEHMQMPETQRRSSTSRGRKYSLRLTARAARRAMIYHEIFSKPKALRTESEMWDNA